MGFRPTRVLDTTFLTLPAARRSADGEYQAWEDGCTPSAVAPGSTASGTLTPPATCAGRSARNIIFNICGTVNRPIAPVTCTGGVARSTCYQLPPPRPNARGIALQYEDYQDENNPDYVSMGPVCVNMESCDQGTNYDVSDPANPLLCGLNMLNPSTVTLPTTFVPSLNYPYTDPSSLNPVSNLYTADPPRQALCAADVNSRDYCKTTGTLCTASSEIIAYYDEGNIQPNFQLNDDTPYTNPNAGINLTFLGALPYSSDSFKCTEIDPGTGFPVERSLNVFIGCDANIKGINVIDYTERGQCQYYITATSAAACGTPVATPTPSPVPAPAAAAAASGLSAPAAAGIASVGSILFTFFATTTLAWFFPVASWGGGIKALGGASGERTPLFMSA